MEAVELAYAYFTTKPTELVRCAVRPDGSVNMAGTGVVPADYARAEIVVLRPVAIQMEPECPGQWAAVALNGGTGRDPVAHQVCGECETCRKAGLAPLSIAVWDLESGITRAASEPERIAFRIAADGGDPAFEEAVTPRCLPEDPADLTVDAVSQELKRWVALCELGLEDAAGDCRARMVDAVLRAIKGGNPQAAELAGLLV